MGLTPQLVLLLTLGVFFASASEFVPVYMWQTIPTKGLFPAITHVSQETFKEILLQKQAHQHSDRMIIFAEQSLSPEDFSAKTFYELSQLSDHTRVTYLQTVSSPMQVIKSFGEIPSVSVDDIINNPSLLEKKQLIIELNDAQDDEDRVDMLKRHSKFIAEVYEKVSASSRDNVLAIYTGSHSSWVVPSDIVKHRQTRAVKKGDIVGHSPHYLVYLNGVFIQTESDGTKKEIKITVDNPVENHDEAKHKGTLSIPTEGATPVILNYITDVFLNWMVASVTFDGKEYVSEMHAPFNFSYSCSSNLTLREQPPKDPNGFKPTFLQFPTFQIQYFYDGEGEVVKKFDDSYDCVGFTSPAIWSGLFVTFILAIILSIGLSMIMDIKTMDRFDDPKGKTIIINATD